MLAQAVLDAAANAVGQLHWIADVTVPIIVNTASGFLIGIGTLVSGWYLLKKTTFYGNVTNLWSQRVPTYQKVNYAAYNLVESFMYPRTAADGTRLARLLSEYFREMNSAEIFCKRPLWKAMSDFLEAVGKAGNEQRKSPESKLSPELQNALQHAFFILRQEVRAELGVDELDVRHNDWHVLEAAKASSE